MLTKFEEYKKEKEKLSDKLKSICSEIDDFISYDADFQKNHNGLPGYVNAFDYYFASDNADEYVDGNFVVEYNKKYYTGRGNRSINQQVIFSNQEYKNLLKFMEDPELYKNVKNYNL